MNFKYSEEDLRPTQLRAIEFAEELGSCCLFPGMGFGKSAVGLTLARNHLRRLPDSSVLVIAPPKVMKESWPEALQEWQHLSELNMVELSGPPMKRTSLVTNSKGKVFTLSQDNIHWLYGLYKHRPGRWPFDLVITDDINVKDPKSRRFKSLRGLRKLIRGLVQMTGTPTGNGGYHDLWGEIYLADKGVRLGDTIETYEYAFFNKDFHGYKFELKPGAQQKIDSLVSDICFFDESEAEAELPPLHNEEPVLTLPKEAQDLYDKMWKDFVIGVKNKTIEASSRAVLSGKLKQIASGAVYYSDQEDVKPSDKLWLDVHDEKLKHLAETMRRFPGEQIIVAYDFHHSLVKLKREFPYAINIKDKNARQRWNNKETPLLLMHPRSGGHGLNLQFGGRITYWYDLDWSLERNKQYKKRVHRPGQTEPCYNIRPVMKGTTDEIMITNIENHGRVQTSFVQALIRKAIRC